MFFKHRGSLILDFSVVSVFPFCPVSFVQNGRGGHVLFYKEDDERRIDCA